jgi:hypothetical protein
MLTGRYIRYHDGSIKNRYVIDFWLQSATWHNISYIIKTTKSNKKTCYAVSGNNVEYRKQKIWQMKKSVL